MVAILALLLATLAIARARAAGTLGRGSGAGFVACRSLRIGIACWAKRDLIVGRGWASARASATVSGIGCETVLNRDGTRVARRLGRRFREVSSCAT